MRVWKGFLVSVVLGGVLFTNPLYALTTEQLKEIKKWTGTSIHNIIKEWGKTIVTLKQSKPKNTNKQQKKQKGENPEWERIDALFKSTVDFDKEEASEKKLKKLKRLNKALEDILLWH